MREPLILDTQLMVLLAVGVTSPRIIKKHKKLSSFTEDDFELLLLLIGADPELLLLPNIVAEAANLLRQHADPEKAAIMGNFASLVAQNKERYIESMLVVRQGEYRKLGVTDTAILEACEASGGILTADAGLHDAALRRGLRSTNFNHKREEFGIL
jgi:hypothetical protein